MTTVKTVPPCAMCAEAVEAVVTRILPSALARGEDPAAPASDRLDLDRYGPHGALRNLGGLAAHGPALDPATMADAILKLAGIGDAAAARALKSIQAIKTTLTPGGPTKVQITGGEPCCLFWITGDHAAYWAEVSRAFSDQALQEKLKRLSAKHPGLKMKPEKPG